MRSTVSWMFAGFLAAGLAACAAGSTDTPDATADAVDTVSPDVAAEEATVLPEVEESAETTGDTEGDVPPGPVTHEGVTAATQGSILSLSNDRIVLRFHLDTGRFDVIAKDGTRLIDHAESRVLFTSGGEDQRVATSDAGTSSWTAMAVDHAWGKGVELKVVRKIPTTLGGAAGVALTDTFELFAFASFFTARTAVAWSFDGQPTGTFDPPVRITRISPVVADADTAGALFVGADPDKHVFLDDGHDIFFDFEATKHLLGDGGSLLFGPGAASNWNAAVYDPTTKRSLVAGFLTSDVGVGVIAANYDSAASTTDTGRKSFTRFEALTHYLDGHGPTAGTQSDWGLASETAYVDLLPQSAFDGLEAYAKFYAARLGKKVWTDIPAGWNSWGGGGGSGGPGQDITLDFMLQNLDLAAADLAPWGMQYFLVDDGWQKDKGDWDPDPTRFPDTGGVNGMKYLGQQAVAKGLRPGLWLEPFSAGVNSQLYKDHPDWFASVAGLGAGLVPKDQRLLDLSQPEVLDFIGALFTKLSQDWGYRWFKVDFSYYELFATGLHDPAATSSEVYHNAIHRIRTAIGPDSFLCGISATGLWFDDGDANRITLDNMPRWGDPVGTGDQGIKVTYKTIANRYYLNHNAWVNHPDLLFFRDNQGLTFAEARAWASAVAMTGGIVKLGETYQAMHDHPDWLETVRPMLPVYPRSGRPLDLFAREYPEVWDLKADRAGRTWDVVGLFNWGRNRDVGGAWEDEGPRDVTITRASLGAASGKPLLVIDAWARTATWLDAGADAITRTLAPRSGVILVVREKPADPAVVFTTRHLMGTAVEVHDEAWDATKGELTFTMDTVPGHDEQVFVANGGRTYKSTDGNAIVTNATIIGGAGGDLVVLTLTPTAAKTSLKVAFASP